MDARLVCLDSNNLHAAIEIVESTDVDSGMRYSNYAKGYMIHDHCFKDCMMQVTK
ncbi:nucleotide exchange factor GrpE [Spiroplasma poulsonii]|uniref:nucleotide exchange factor GrpE n=1 Tax=Spiroplasma poulsonii TaxID=2138 RepID=UPI001F4CE513|nr:nucleotide exchange factor GrpE [Spiroplasma poulsonii]UNF62617.1 nucleotide exchange factor GrpE [Spiroplasma poulsonii]